MRYIDQARLLQSKGIPSMTKEDIFREYHINGVGKSDLINMPTEVTQESPGYVYSNCRFAWRPDISNNRRSFIY